MYGPVIMQQRFPLFSNYSSRTYSYDAHLILGGNIHKAIPKLRISNINSGIQMDQVQIQAIRKAIFSNGNVLVWGLGNDSPYWHKSTKGKVIFIEDDSPSRKAGIQWYDKIMQKYPYLESYRVKYKTKNIKSFTKYINHPERWHELDLRDQLPESVTQTHWHVIIVDAPLGCCKMGPGRYQSIYTSWKLAKEGTHIFVDDFERKIEHELSIKMFGKPEEIIKRKKRKYSQENEQAHFILKSNYSFLQINGTRNINKTEPDRIHSLGQDKNENMSHDWSLLLTLNNGYFDLFINWRLHFIKLNISLQIYIIAEDDNVYNKLSKLNRSDITIKRSDYISIEEAATFNSYSYKKIVSARPSYILSFLREGKNIIFCDLDTVWLKDPRPYLTGNYDMWSEMDEEETGTFCTCFLALRSNSKTTKLMEMWQKALNVKLTRNQAIFNKLMYKTSLKTKVLNMTLFPSGKQYFDRFSDVERSSAVIVHNNWIQGYNKKVKRFKKMNLWLNGTLL